MRDGEARRIEAALGEPEDVQIDQARSPAFEPNAAEPSLDREQRIEQRKRRERGREQDRRVQKQGLRRADGCRFVERRDAAHGSAIAERSHRVRKQRAPIAQVRSESNHRFQGAPSLELEHQPVAPLPHEGLAPSAEKRQIQAMFGLTHGELGLTAFIVVAILSARYWPRAGEWVAKRLSRETDAEE
jgi:hypothetical protein